MDKVVFSILPCATASNHPERPSIQTKRSRSPANWRAWGVDVIEAGFPASSPGDLEGVRRVAREVQGPVICGLARCVRGDIDAAWEAVKDRAAAAHSHVYRHVGTFTWSTSCA